MVLLPLFSSINETAAQFYAKKPCTIVLLSNKIATLTVYHWCQQQKREEGKIKPQSSIE